MADDDDNSSSSSSLDEISLHDDDDMDGEVHYLVDKRDMFPEQWGPFLLGDDRIRAAFMKYHADLLTPTRANASFARATSSQSARTISSGQ